METTTSSSQVISLQKETGKEKEEMEQDKENTKENEKEIGEEEEEGRGKVPEEHVVEFLRATQRHRKDWRKVLADLKDKHIVTGGVTPTELGKFYSNLKNRKRSKYMRDFEAKPFKISKKQRKEMGEVEVKRREALHGAMMENKRTDHDYGRNLILQIEKKDVISRVSVDFLARSPQHLFPKHLLLNNRFAPPMG